MKLLSIILFSMAGAGLRYLISDRLDFIFIIMLINLTGAYLLGYASSKFQRININPALSTGITTGFLGSFTTFSTLSMEVVHFIEHEQWISLILYLICSIFGGIWLANIGMNRGAK